MRHPFAGDPYSNIHVPKDRGSECYSIGNHVHSSIFDLRSYRICLSNHVVNLNDDLTHKLQEGVTLLSANDIGLIPNTTITDRGRQLRPQDKEAGRAH